MIRSTMCAVLTMACVVLPESNLSAQAVNTTDGVWTIWNNTDKAITIQAVSMLKRDGTVQNINQNYTFASGANLWMEVNGQKVTGVWLKFIIHTADGHQSIWEAWSNGNDKDGYTTTKITPEWLASHAKTPVPVGGIKPYVPHGVQWLSEYLQKQVVRVQGYVNDDTAYLTKAGIGADAIPKVLDGIDTIRPRSDDWQKELGIWILKELGKEAARQFANREIEDALYRIKTNKALIQQYEQEMNALKEKLKTIPMPSNSGRTIS